MDKDEFAEQLPAALAHLYDHAYLEAHPLVQLLVPESERQSSARALGRLLTQTIEALRPADDLPRSSRPWRNYRYLLLRYVRLQTAAEVSRELNLSERQSRRVHREAIEALAAALWPAVLKSQEATPALPPGTRAPGGRARHEDLGLPWLSEVTADGCDLQLEVGEAARMAATPGERDVRLADVVAGVLSTTDRLAVARKATISADVPLDLPPIAVERTLLRQGLLSLFVAALNSGARLIRLSCSTLVTRVEVSLLASTDPAAAGADARELLSRVREDRSLKVGSHLLGMQGGAVDVRDGPGGAAIIQVTLPLVKPSTVLLVDDNPDTILLFRRYLGGGAYRIVEATSGKRAVQLARELHPAAVVLDVMMPGQDGWEILQILRNHPDTRDVPVIVCSVLDQRDLALSLGAFDLLAKPVTPQALLQAIECCLAETAAQSG